MKTNALYPLFRSRFPSDDRAVFLQLDGGRQITYGSIDDATGRIVNWMEDVGLSKGERVMVQVEKSSTAVLLYLACLRAGTVFIPLNTAYTLAEFSYFAKDAGPSLIVCTPERIDGVVKIAEALDISNVFTLDPEGAGSLFNACNSCSSECDETEIDGDDLAAILYTSGTTGQSKGAMLTHENLASNALTLHRSWGWTEGDVLLHALPIFHAHGLFVALHCALLNGSPSVFLSQFDVNKVIKWLPRATVFMGVPTFYTRLLDEQAFTSELCRHMRLFISGSAPLRADTFDAFEARTGQRILERYGMTEALMITSNPYDGPRIAGTVGFALPDIAIRVVDDKGNQVTEGEPGVLEITGPNIFKGYWRNPEKTKAEFRDDGYFITGDIATIDADGRVTLVGRTKDLIISGGYNVYPKEIERLIDAIDGVKESAIVGVPHPDFGEGVIAVVVGDGSLAMDGESIINRLQGNLARFKQPKEIVFVDELPRNTMGKVQKNLLRDQYFQSFKG